MPPCSQLLAFETNNETFRRKSIAEQFEGGRCKLVPKLLQNCQRKVMWDVSNGVFPKTLNDP